MSRITKTLKGEQYLVTHTVGHGQAGIRLDRYLREHYRARSREKLKRAIDSGAITVLRRGPHHQDLPLWKPSTPLHAGDIVHVLSTRRPEPDVDFNYKIIFEDEHLLLVDKPANLPVHPSGRFFFHTLLIHLKTDGFKLVQTNDRVSLQGRTKGAAGAENRKRNKNYANERKFFLAHRLDKETSGLILIAKSSPVCAELQRQFSNRETEKHYLALVHGVPAKKEFSVSAAINKKKGSAIGLKMHPVPVEDGGMPCHTDFKVIESRGNFTLLACYPKTGRQHQIRAHAEIAGHPLVGDKIYGLCDEDALQLIARYRLQEDEAHSDDSEAAEETAAETMPASETLDDALDGTAGAESAQSGSNTLDWIALEKLDQKLILKRHALHAAGLKFIHPVTHKPMHFEIGLPPDLDNFFESLKSIP